MTDKREPTTFDDEIDLRQYLQIFLNHWPWIVAMTVIGALVAAGFTFFFVSPTYEATTLVAITPPKYLMEFSPEFQALTQERIQTEIYGTYPEFAQSDEVLQQLSDLLAGELGGELPSIEALRGKTSVRASKEVGLIFLTARNSDPRKAATTANAWAGLYIEMLNRLYGSDQGDDYGFFASQLVSAQNDLTGAQEALAEFKARDPSALLDSEVQASIEALDGYLAEEHSVEAQKRTIENWRAQLASQSGDQAVSRIDELTSLFMQLQAFGIIQESAQPQFQVSVEQMAAEWGVTEQNAFLENLSGLLQRRAAELDALVRELQPEILRMQRDLQAAQNEGERLTQEVEIAKLVYQSLALKAEEARIASESVAGVAQLASKAAVPLRSVSSGLLLNTAMGAALGFVVGVVLAVLLELVGSSRTTAQDDGVGDGR
jgi:uncharacterized protein involved in exopolysaccharide biosynthesis